MTDTRGESRVPGATRCPLELEIADATSDAIGLDPTVWTVTPYGEEWSKITLLHGEDVHPLYTGLRGIRRVVQSLTNDPMDVSLASLGPGGKTKIHRDVSGGAAMGVVRFHVPLVTHDAARMLVSGRDLHLRVGEAWILDTTYPHAVFNNGTDARVHLIVDAPRRSVPAELRPPRDVRTATHTAAFALRSICSVLLGAVKRPRRTWLTLSDAFRIRVIGKAPREHGDR